MYLNKGVINIGWLYLLGILSVQIGIKIGIGADSCRERVGLGLVAIVMKNCYD